MDIFTARLDSADNRICTSTDLVDQENRFFEVTLGFSEGAESTILDSINGTECEYLPIGTISAKLEE
jgi:hypothetical protein